MIEDRKVEERTVGLLQTSLERSQTYTQKLFLALNGCREDWSLHNAFKCWVARAYLHKVKLLRPRLPEDVDPASLPKSYDVDWNTRSQTRGLLVLVPVRLES